MFRIIKIVLIILIVSTLNATTLYLTSKGIENEKGEILNTSVKKEKINLDIFSIRKFKEIENVILYEALDNYKKQCAIFTNIIDNNYVLSDLMCIEIVTDFSKEPPANWMLTFKKLDNIKIEKANFYEIINSTSKYNSLAINKNNKLIFKNIPSNKFIDLNQIEFRISVTNENFPFITLDDLIFSKLDKNKKELTLTQKTQLYKTPSEETITKMYLIAGDKADLLEEKTDEKGVKWYNILYHGKKDINAWIKADESINLEKEDK